MAQLKTLMEFRRDMYTLLAFPFYMEITSGYGQKLVNFLTSIKVNQPDLENPEMLRGLDICLNYSDKLTAPDEAENWAKLFSYTFLVYENSNSIKPYESVYLSKAKIIMQEERDRVLEFYAKCHKVRAEGFMEPEDHIAAELGFMSGLSSDILGLIEISDKEAILKNIELQKEFLDEHLLKWAKLLANDMQKPDNSSFFAGFGQFMSGFVKEDRLLLEDIETIIV